MEFQKAIKIKGLVNQFNRIRNGRDYPKLTLSFEMFELGKWAVDITIPNDTCLYSRECSALFSMLSQLGCCFFIGFHCHDNVIYIQ